MFPVSPLLLTGVSFLAVSLIIWLLADHFVDQLVAHMTSGLSVNGSPVQALKAAHHALLWLLLPVSLAVLVPGVVVALLPALRARRRGVTAVPLPSGIPTRLDGFVVGAICLAVIVPMSMAVIQGAGFTYEEVARTPAAAAGRILQTLAKISGGAGAVMVAGGVLQLSLYKVRLLRALSLDKGEAQREARLHEGTGGARKQR